ncbi:protoporphyrinogen oxidase [Silvanigrella aquatica]|nr:protoporphyrinogen oxidase [Silvanigrella aquatica]
MKSKEKLINIAIIGTGVSGLKCAYLIAKNTSHKINRIVLFDKNNRMGGVLQQTYEKGYLLEHGAQGVLLSRTPFYNCLNELNIQDSVIIPNQKEQTRYLLTEKACVPLKPKFIFKKGNGLLCIKDIFRILSEFFIKKPKNNHINETMYSFFERHFGKKFADIFLVSLSFGIWGGGSKKLLIRYTFPQLLKIEYGYGSLMKYVLFTAIRKIFNKKANFKTPKGLASFEKGMSYLTESLFNKLQAECKKNNIELIIKMKTQICNLGKGNGSLYLEYETFSDQEKIKENYDSIIYSGQLWRDDKLKIEINSEEGQKSLENLRNMESHSIAVIGLGGKYLNSQNNSFKGFGALAGSWSKDILGVIFIHSTYPSHVPKDSFLFRVMLGGDRDPGINNKRNDELIDLAKKRLFEKGIITDNMLFEFEHVVKWNNYIPLATENQDIIIESIWRIEALLPGLFFAGNYLKGVSISDCLEQAELTSKKLLNYFKNI